MNKRSALILKLASSNFAEENKENNIENQCDFNSISNDIQSPEPFSKNSETLEKVETTIDDNSRNENNLIGGDRSGNPIASSSKESNYERDLENFSDFEDSGSEYDPGIATAESSSSSSDCTEDSTLEQIEDENLEPKQRKSELILDRLERKGRPKRGRNAKYPGQTFRNRKILKDSNKKHYSIKGKLIEPKVFIDFLCNCTLKCKENVSQENRKKVFEKFWGLASYNAQTAYIAATVRQQGIKRKRNKESTRRQYTRVYEISSVKVCRDMYIKTLQISPKRVNTALNKIRTGSVKDERGFMQGGHNKLSEETKNKVIHQISRFATYISHYTRNESEAKYLATDLTLRKMFSLYTEGEPNHKIGFSSYKTIFYENFNLRRKAPVKDTCNACDGFNAKIKNYQHDGKLLKEEQELKHTQHLQKAKEARESMKADMEETKTNVKLETATYDMEKVLGLPKLPTNIVYYKRQLSIYNEGIHTGTNDTPYCFVWKEGVAGRGAQEVGSCLKKFIDIYLSPETEELILWSDSCGGQNRNIKIVLLLKAILEGHPSLKRIYLKYLIPGHSFLPNDTDFGEIERSIKYQIRLYTLEEFKKVIQQCSQKKKFVVVEMEKEDFLGTSKLEKLITNRKTDVNGNKISWLETRVIKLNKECPFSIFLKYTHHVEEEFKEINIRKVSKGRPNTQNDFYSHLFELYPNGKEISRKKLADIKSLMALVPNDVKDFYRNLNVGDFQDDIDGFGENIDFLPEIDEDEAHDEDKNDED